MSDLKMSDVFDLPVIEGNFVNEHTRRVCDQKGTFSMSNISASSRVAHAINNHDRLVEKVAQLEADKAELLIMISILGKANINLVELKLLPHQGYEKRAIKLADDAMNLLQKHKG